MSLVLHARCLNHPDREAVAQCPLCRHTFCRECVTDHEGRVICAKCLDALVRKAGRPRRKGWGILAVAQAATGWLLLWLLLYGTGRILLAIPQPFHEGTIWSSPWSDE